MPRFAHIQTLHAPKDPAHPGDYEDACQFDAARGIAAIADGVASAMFSGIWAKLLVESIVATDPCLHPLPPEPLLNPDEATSGPEESNTPDIPEPEAASDQREQFHQWLQNCRREWHRKIDFRSLNFFQFEKLKQSGGAFSTLLWLDVTPTDDPAIATLRCTALGDGNLFHFRHGELLTSFPMQGSEEYDLAPHALCSMKSERDTHLAWLTHVDECVAGDLLVLCTDAVGQWVHQSLEAGQPIDWDRLWTMSLPEWEAEVESLRAARTMRTDDATLLMLSVETQDLTVEETPAGDTHEAAAEKTPDPCAETTETEGSNIDDRASPAPDEFLLCATDDPAREESRDPLTTDGGHLAN